MLLMTVNNLRVGICVKDITITSQKIRYSVTIRNPSGFDCTNHSEIYLICPKI